MSELYKTSSTFGQHPEEPVLNLPTRNHTAVEAQRYAKYLRELANTSIIKTLTYTNIALNEIADFIVERENK